jgi:hypothetical protein
VIEQLEMNSKLEDARLDVAEELGWPVAILAGVAAYMYFHNWWIPLIAVPITYYAVTYRYRRCAELAEDKYFQAAGLGKYFAATSAQNDSTES